MNLFNKVDKTPAQKSEFEELAKKLVTSLGVVLKLYMSVGDEEKVDRDNDLLAAIYLTGNKVYVNLPTFDIKLSYSDESLNLLEILFKALGINAEESAMAQTPISNLGESGEGEQGTSDNNMAQQIIDVIKNITLKANGIDVSIIDTFIAELFEAFQIGGPDYNNLNKTDASINIVNENGNLFTLFDSISANLEFLKSNNEKTGLSMGISLVGLGISANKKEFSDYFQNLSEYKDLMSATIYLQTSGNVDFGLNASVIKFQELLKNILKANKDIITTLTGRLSGEYIIDLEANINLSNLDNLEIYLSLTKVGTSSNTKVLSIYYNGVNGLLACDLSGLVSIPPIMIEGITLGKVLKESLIDMIFGEKESSTGNSNETSSFDFKAFVKQLKGQIDFAVLNSKAIAGESGPGMDYIAIKINNRLINSILGAVLNIDLSNFINLSSTGDTVDGEPEQGIIGENGFAEIGFNFNGSAIDKLFVKLNVGDKNTEEESTYLYFDVDDGITVKGKNQLTSFNSAGYIDLSKVKSIYLGADMGINVNVPKEVNINLGSALTSILNNLKKHCFGI